MNQKSPQRVVVLGASANPARMSYQAVKRLSEAGHEVVPVHPAIDTLLGADVTADLMEVRGKVDTLTVYVNPARSSAMTETIVERKPGRVIFNPGAENPELTSRLEAEGIPCENACTLVLLSTGEF